MEQENPLIILNNLALRYLTDKRSALHNYMRWYAKQLPPRSMPICLLEIGVFKGQSLRMWRDYYCKEAVIAGLDIDYCSPIDGVKIFKGDQSSEVTVAEIIGEIDRFDVVIDDGSHNWKDVVASFKLLWPHIKSGGLYVIEDIQCGYSFEFGKCLEMNTIDFLNKLVDEFNCYGAGNIGDIRNAENYDSNLEYISIYQKTVESITFYPNIVFIRKLFDAH